MTNDEKILELLTALKEDMSDVKTRLVKVEVTHENIVVPQIQALAEGVSTINDKLIARSEIDAMKEEPAFLKDIIRMHTSQINDLKKAQ